MIKIQAGQRLKVQAANPDEYKVSDMMLDDAYKSLKILAKFVRDANLGTSSNGAADGILKNEKMDIKVFRSELKILVSSGKDAVKIISDKAIKDLGK